MLSVKGTFRDGVAQPSEVVEAREGQPVIITFLDEKLVETSPALEDEVWDALTQLVAECAVDTGITDLAHQHDHYLYGKSKKA
jgi:hypothetical protein